MLDLENCTSLTGVGERIPFALYRSCCSTLLPRAALPPRYRLPRLLGPIPALGPSHPQRCPAPRPAAGSRPTILARRPSDNNNKHADSNMPIAASSSATGHRYTPFYHSSQNCGCSFMTADSLAPGTRYMTRPYARITFVLTRYDSSYAWFEPVRLVQLYQAYHMKRDRAVVFKKLTFYKITPTEIPGTGCSTDVSTRPRSAV